MRARSAGLPRILPRRSPHRQSLTCKNLTTRHKAHEASHEVAAAFFDLDFDLRRRQESFNHKEHGDHEAETTTKNLLI